MGQALVSNIQRLSLDDGPGIRTTVFLKGCPLRCRWCHNPECIAPRRQLLHYAAQCAGCGSCAKVCPEGVFAMEDAGDGGTVSRIIARERCTFCGKCIDFCPKAAITTAGKEYTVDGLKSVLLRDANFYRNSGGGVTLSGGEPLLQGDFTLEMLMALKQAGIHTAVDTCGYVPYEQFEKVIEYTDLFLFDIKTVDPKLHRELTGHGNGLILENYKRLCASGVRIWVRMPLVAGVNDGEAEKTAALLKEYPAELVELLPYHAYGVSKYESLGMEYPGKGYEPPAKEQLAELAGLFRGQVHIKES